jgi:hypothetical protein
LSCRDVPATLPRSAHEILRRLRCDLIDEEDVRAEWLTTLADPLHHGAVRDEIGLLVDQALTRVDDALWRPSMSYTAPKHASVRGR